MSDIRIIPVKLICSVPGCKNIETFSISRNGEMRHGVNICPECVKALYNENEVYFTEVDEDAGTSATSATKKRFRKATAANEPAGTTGTPETSENIKGCGNE